MKISGTILDKSDSSPLPGANINLLDPSGKVSTFGTVSDANGKFSLDSASILPNTNFTISFIGYKSQVFSASELSNKTVFLSESAYELNELVITKDNTNLNTNNFVSGIASNLKKNKKSYALAIGVIAIVGSLILIKKNI